MLMDFLSRYFTRHVQAGIYSLGKFTRSPAASFMTCLIIGIALALPAALFVVLKNAEAVGNTIQQTMQLTVYLKKSVTETQTQDLGHALQSYATIQSVRIVSPAAGLKELQSQTGLDDIRSYAQDNPLPWVIILTPQETALTPTKLEQLEQRIKLLPQVDSVQIDMQWVERLTTLLLIAHRVATVLAIFLGLAVLLIVNNVIRTTTQQHQKEIEVIQLIGGTHAFIRRPFLYAGLLYGLAGGLIAWLLVDITLFALKTPINHLAALCNSQFTLLSMSLTHTLLLLACSAALGLLGSWLAVTKHLWNIPLYQA